MLSKFFPQRNHSHKEPFQSKPVDIESQIEPKKTRKYHKIDRALQAKILQEAPRMSQRQLAQKYNIPKTTLQHWVARQRELKGKNDPNVVAFFESPSGQAWLHKATLATFMIFHQNGNSGIPDLHEFFEMIGISVFVGTSVCVTESRQGHQQADSCF